MASIVEALKGVRVLRRVARGEHGGGQEDEA